MEGRALDFHSSIPLSTPLHAACFQGHLEVVRLLVSQPGIELNTLDIDGHTPLMVAVEGGHETTVRLLLEKGADPKVKNSKGRMASDIAREQIGKREKLLKMITDAKTATEPDAAANDRGGRR